MTEFIINALAGIGFVTLVLILVEWLVGDLVEDDPGDDEGDLA